MSPGRTRYIVPSEVIVASQTFLRDRGAFAYEGTALWAGKATSQSAVRVTRLIVPEQVAETTEWGARVDLTERAHLGLTDLLEPGERFFVRIHSHPELAYHSARDDANQILSHQGAISVVVPFFASRPIVLTDCAVFKLDHGRGWIQLSIAEISATFTVSDEVE